MKECNNKTQEIWKKVLPTNDLVFKKTFGTPKNSHILTGFINDILDLEVMDVSVENTYNFGTFCTMERNPKIRYTQVDVLARLADGSQVTIEMQVVPQKLFIRRAFYYAAEIYVSNHGKHSLMKTESGFSKGEEKYEALRTVYGINILANNAFKDDDPIHEYEIYDVRHKANIKEQTGQEEIRTIFLEIKKTSDEMKTNMKAWFDYFNTGTVAKDAPKYIQEACDLANFGKLDKEEQDMISEIEKSIEATVAREAYVREEASAEGKAEGRAEGRAEGKAEGKAELLRDMISRGKTIKEIAEFAGISESEVKSIIE